MPTMTLSSYSLETKTQKPVVGHGEIISTQECTSLGKLKICVEEKSYGYIGF